MRFLVLSSLIATTLVACSPAKSSRTATKRVARQNELLASLAARGAPRPEWSEADLVRFEADVAKLESLDPVANGDVVAKMRGQVAVARALKSGQTAGVNAAAVLAKAKQTEADVLRTVIKIYSDGVDKFEKQYLNNDAVQESDLPAARRELEKLIEMNANIVKSPALSADEKRQFEKAGADLVKLRESLASDQR